MVEVVIEIPHDVGIEFEKVAPKNWQLLFSRFLSKEFGRLQELASIIEKSELTEAQARELADEVSIAIARRLLEE